MRPSLIEIGSKTAEKISAQTNRKTDTQTDTTKIMVTWPWTKTERISCPHFLCMSPQYGELRPTSGWDRFVSLGHPNNFNGFRVLTALLHGTLWRQPNFAALNRGRHLCSAGRPSRWALAHILVLNVSLSLTGKEFWKSVKTGQSHRHEFGGPAFLEQSVFT